MCPQSVLYSEVPLYYVDAWYIIRSFELFLLAIIIIKKARIDSLNIIIELAPCL